MDRAAGAREFLDGPVPPADRDAALRDIDRLNAWFGGYALSLRALARLTARRPRGLLTVVDVGGGAGHFAARVARWSRRAGRPVRVVVVDRELGALRLGARSGAVGAGPGALGAGRGARPDVLAVCAEATALPFREGAVDVVVTALTLHHLEPDDAARTLGEMAAAARLGIVVNDLLRTRLSLGLVWLATRLFARHRFARHDGPLSVRRAYAPAELAVLAEKVGIGPLDVRTYRLLGRLVAVTP